jgi:hypothetical protein
LEGFLSFADNFAIYGKAHWFFSSLKPVMSTKRSRCRGKWPSEQHGGFRPKMAHALLSG